MTTTVTVETHDCPVAVQIEDNSSFDTPEVTGWSHGVQTQFVAAHTKRCFYVTDTRTLTFRELPKEATSLHGTNGCLGQVAASQIIPTTDD